MTKYSGLVLIAYKEAQLTKVLPKVIGKGKWWELPLFKDFRRFAAVNQKTLRDPAPFGSMLNVMLDTDQVANSRRLQQSGRQIAQALRHNPDAAAALLLGKLTPIPFAGEAAAGGVVAGKGLYRGLKRIIGNL